MKKYANLFKKLTEVGPEEKVTHFIWEVADDMFVKVIHDRPYPLFDLEDISWLFGYEFNTVKEESSIKVKGYK